MARRARSAWEAVRAGEPPRPVLVGMRLAGTHAIRQAADVVDLAYRVGGTTGIFADHPPVEYCGFSLHPVGFFERNPALDVAPNKHCAD